MWLSLVVPQVFNLLIIEVVDHIFREVPVDLKAVAARLEGVDIQSLANPAVLTVHDAHNALEVGICEFVDFPVRSFEKWAIFAPVVFKLG